MGLTGTIKGCAAIVLTGIAVSAAGCTMAPMIGGEDGRNLATSGPVTYRDLASIPDRPEPSKTEEKQRSLNGLSEDRESAVRAASDLREAPFAAPEPVSLARPVSP